MSTKEETKSKGPQTHDEAVEVLKKAMLERIQRGFVDGEAVQYMIALNLERLADVAEAREARETAKTG